MINSSLRESEPMLEFHVIIFLEWIFEANQIGLASGYVLYRIVKGVKKANKFYYIHTQRHYLSSTSSPKIETLVLVMS